ncbi:MAG: high-potential iron-sulfur protein [Alphaproteobacteria bacterium]|jgi:hypothetical protein|nr:high-potential iron-sulfur protein [Alphaproteobacteria bacterium]
MSQEPKSASRRTVLIGAVALGGLPLLAAAGAAQAAGTLPKANAHYQDHPNAGKQCSKCNYFLPGAKPTAVGQCKVVAGPIAPNGWCTMFAPKAG